MKPDPKRLIHEAMQLEPASRALVAETLLESLDVGADVEISDEWREEIRRRCEAIDQGTIDLVQGDQVLDKLRHKYD
jgi:putative addiction module component (TIGR02574 family)